MRATSVLPREYIELQLRFARWLAHGSDASYPAAVLHGTNLFARFRLGPRAGAEANVDWQDYVADLASLTTLDEQVELTSVFFTKCVHRLTGAGPQTDKLRSGAFSAEAADGVLRFHFVPELGGSVSPLHTSQLGRRRAELASLVGQVFERHLDIVTVRGGSWLYNTRGYCSLFPPAHVATARPRPDLLQFQGSSSWGQFLDHRGEVKADLGRRFLSRLDACGPTVPSRTFPLPSLTVESPIVVFADHFGRGR